MPHSLERPMPEPGGDKDQPRIQRGDVEEHPEDRDRDPDDREHEQCRGDRNGDKQDEPGKKAPPKSIFEFPHHREGSPWRDRKCHAS